LLKAWVPSRKKGFTAQAPRAAALNRAVLTVLQLLSSGSAVPQLPLSSSQAQSQTQRAACRQPFGKRRRSRPHIFQVVTDVLEAVQRQVFYGFCLSFRIFYFSHNVK